MPGSSSPTHVRSLLRANVRTDIYIIFAAMDTDKIKVFGARLKVSSPAELAQLERAERVCIFANVLPALLTPKILGQNGSQNNPDCLDTMQYFC